MAVGLILSWTPDTIGFHFIQVAQRAKIGERSGDLMALWMRVPAPAAKRARINLMEEYRKVGEYDHKRVKVFIKEEGVEREIEKAEQKKT